ncbi:MAG: chemotaxis protein CheD [Pseudomonadota bacterium]
MASIPVGQRQKTRHVTQGEVCIADADATCVTTILGSCIATLIWDPEAKVGGLNHLLLPDARPQNAAAMAPDVNLMELLINGVLSAGGARKRFRAKIFGGAQMIDGLGSTGAANVQFVERFLADEGIPCLARSTGGRHARRLRVWPAQGRVQQKRVANFDPTIDAPDPRRLRKQALKLSGVELL